MAVEYQPFASLLARVIDNRGRTCPVDVAGVPLIATNCIKNDLLYPTFENVRYVNRETYDNWFRGHPEPGDLIFVTKGSPGRTCMAPDPVGFCIAQDMVALRADPSKVRSRYLFAALRSPEVQASIEQMHVGTLIPHFKKGDFDKLLIPVPDQAAQEFIGDFYFELSRKIDLNRRTNETLESLARSIFKSWFVDFDPVRAKMEGRRPAGMDAETAAMFPDRMQESEIGEIPAGWEVGTLGELLEQRVERCEASDETASRPYVPIDCISSRSLFLAESRPGPEAQSSLTRFYTGDLLFGAMRPYFHKVCIAPFEGTTRTTAFVLLPSRAEDFAFATLLLHHRDTIDYATRHSTGSTIPYAAWSNSLENMPVIVPNAEVRDAFDRVMRPVLDRIPAPHFENKTLADLRDTLLPKLLSGKLRIPDAEKIVEAAT